jgi:hypothetical protein
MEYKNMLINYNKYNKKAFHTNKILFAAVIQILQLFFNSPWLGKVSELGIDNRFSQWIHTTQKQTNNQSKALTYSMNLFQFTEKIH